MLIWLLLIKSEHRPVFAYVELMKDHSSVSSIHFDGLWLFKQTNTLWVDLHLTRNMRLLLKLAGLYWTPPSPGNRTYTFSYVFPQLTPLSLCFFHFYQLFIWVEERSWKCTASGRQVHVKLGLTQHWNNIAGIMIGVANNISPTQAPSPPPPHRCAHIVNVQRQGWGESCIPSLYTLWTNVCIEFLCIQIYSC